MNFAAFDLNLLRVFDALMRERSVTRAGEQVGLSQPAVSAALSRLRALLDDQLFVRKGPEMAPTPRAEALALTVRETLSRLELALQGDRGFDPAAAERSFTLMGADFVSMLIMPRLFALTGRVAPGVRLRLVDTAWGELQRLFQDDAIDLAIERPGYTADWITSVPLFLSPFAIVAASGRADIAAAGARPGDVLPLDLFCDMPHALRSVDGSIAGHVDDALAEQGRRRRVVLTLPHFSAVALAVAQSPDLIAALPVQFARAVSGTLGLDLYEAPIPVFAPEIQMYWHRRHDDNPAHKWLRDQVRHVTADF